MNCSSGSETDDESMKIKNLKELLSKYKILRQKTANSTEYVRIHPARSHSVSVVTRAHNARSYDVDHGCMKSKPVDVNVPAAAFNRCCRHADFTNSNDSSCSLRVVLYETREAIEIGLHCVHTSLVFSEAFKKLNPVFR